MQNADAGTGEPASHPARPASTRDLLMIVPAVPSRVPEVRHRLRNWLDDQRWPVEDAEDIELAASEALANVVDHAYLPQTPGPANLHAWATIHPRTGTRRVVVTITDSGRWGRHHPAAPAPAARGHGLTIMRGCTEEMHIQHSEAGTTIILISRSVPAGS